MHKAAATFRFAFYGFRRNLQILNKFICLVGARALLRLNEHVRTFVAFATYFVCSVVVDNIRPKEKFAYVLPLAPYGQALTTRFNFIPQSAALTAPFKRSLLLG